MLTTKIIQPLGTTFLDYPDNESLAVIVYFLGCEHMCEGCHNPAFKVRDNKVAIEISIKDLYDSLYIYAQENRTTKVVFSGGDPLHPLNREFIKLFISKYRNIFDFCVYTGYPIEEVKLMDIKYFKFIKVGGYDITKAQLSDQSDNFMRLASTNQEIYNENFSLLTRNGVLNFK